MVGNEWIEVKVPSTPKATANTWVELHLPNAKTLGRYLAWGVGRVMFSTTISSVVVTRNTLKMGIILCDWLEGGVKNLLKIYDALPYGGTPMTQVIEASAKVLDEPLQIITDIITAIEGKQVMIIGEMGTGKSTLAQYLAYTVGGAVKVYEPEGTPDDWKGLEVTGKGEDWSAIDEGMSADLEDLSNQLKIRNEKGDAALVGTDRVIIAEEYPELVTKVASSGEWLERHARRGRKARRFTILLSQYDRVSAWGLEGKGDLAEAFFRIRLGKKAQAHAKVLKNERLVEWLKADKSHCLLDDQPLKLPPYREMKAATMRGSTTIPQLLPNNPIQPNFGVEQSPEALPEADSSDLFSQEGRLLWRMIQRYGEGKSDSQVVTEVMGFTGNRYAKGMDLLQRFRREFGE
ncbi:MAG: hypothetical protein KA716_31945 [Gloeotrichia echinulata DEX184]|nr:hypothetical protein [Gloeotrichia echinulata DEX184]MCM0594549.1 hypothetical protein [Gloeotrichia echinulata DEX184]